MVFDNVIKFKVSLHWSRVGPNPTGVLIRGAFGYRQSQREDSHVETEAEIGMMLSQARDLLAPPEAGRGTEGSSTRGCRRKMLLSTP